MSLKVPKYLKNESSFELEKMLDSTPLRKRGKPNYGPLKELHSKGKVKSN